MAIDRRILENTWILAGSQIVAQFANFGFFIVFARAFGADLLGEYTFALSLGALLAAVVGLGSYNLILRSASQDIRQWRKLTGILLPVQVALSVTVLLLVATGMRLAENLDSTRWIVTLVCAFQLIVPFSAVLSLGFTAQERMVYSGVSHASRSISVFVLGTAAVWLGLSADWTVLALPIVALTIVLVVYRLARAEFGAPEFRFDVNEFAAVLRRTLPFLGISLATVIFLRIGVLMLRAISGAEAVGVFSAAERLVMAAVVLQTMFISALFPQLAKRWKTDTDGFARLVAQGQRLIVLTTLPGATVLVLFAADVVRLLFGTDFLLTTRVLEVIAWALVIRGICGLTTTVAIAQDRQADVVTSKLVGLLVLVGVCGALAPRYAGVGLAVAVIVAEFSVLVTLVLRLGHAAFLSSVWAPFLRSLAACTVAAVTALALGSHELWPRAGAVCGTGLLSLWLFGAVRWHDIRHFSRLISSRSTPDS